MPYWGIKHFLDELVKIKEGRNLNEVSEKRRKVSKQVRNFVWNCLRDRHHIIDRNILPTTLNLKYQITQFIKI